MDMVYIMVTKTLRDNECESFNILFETKTSKKTFIVKENIVNSFKNLSIFFELEDLGVFSCNNKFTAIRSFTSTEFDIAYAGFSDISLFSEKFKMEIWARSRVLSGVCEKDDPFVKSGGVFCWDNCNNYLKKKLEKMRNFIPDQELNIDFITIENLTEIPQQEVFEPIFTNEFENIALDFLNYENFNF